MNTHTYMVTHQGKVLISGVSMQTAMQVCYDTPDSLIVECKMIDTHQHIVRAINAMQEEDRRYIQHIKETQEQLKLPKELLNIPGVRVKKDNTKYADKSQMYLVGEIERRKK